MTDIWCFTCSHEIRLNFVGGYAHVDITANTVLVRKKAAAKTATAGED